MTSQMVNDKLEGQWQCRSMARSIDLYINFQYLIYTAQWWYRAVTVVHMETEHLQAKSSCLLYYKTSINNNVYPGCTRRLRKGQDLRGHILFSESIHLLSLEKSRSHYRRGTPYLKLNEVLQRSFLPVGFFLGIGEAFRPILLLVSKLGCERSYGLIYRQK